MDESQQVKDLLQAKIGGSGIIDNNAFVLAVAVGAETDRCVSLVVDTCSRPSEGVALTKVGRLLCHEAQSSRSSSGALHRGCSSRSRRGPSNARSYLSNWGRSVDVRQDCQSSPADCAFLAAVAVANSLEMTRAIAWISCRCPACQLGV